MPSYPIRGRRPGRVGFHRRLFVAGGAVVPLGIVSVTDTVATVSESLARTAVHPRTASDTIATISDSIAKSAIKSRSASDTATTFSESVARAAVHPRTAVDTIATITDSVARVAVHPRTASDTLATVSDSVAVARVFARAASDTATTMSDAVATSRSRRLTDTLTTMSDSVASRRNRQLVDVAVVGRVNYHQNGGIETGTSLFFDYQSRGSLSRVTTEHQFGAAALKVVSTTSGASTDFGVFTVAILPYRGSFTHSGYVKGEGSAIGKQITIYIQPTGAGVQNTQTFTLTGSWQRISVSSPDIDAGQVNLFYLVSPVIAVGDTFYLDGVQVEPGLVATPYQETSGSVAVEYDSLAAAKVKARTLTDTAATVTDSLATKRSRTVTDTACTMSDSVASSRSRSLSDTAATVTDSVVRAGSTARAVSDTLATMSDSVAKSAVKTRTASDTATTIAESIASKRTRAISDTAATMSDSVAKSAVKTRTASDTAVTMSDSIAPQRTRARQLSDIAIEGDLPTVLTLDDFNRADGGLGSNWTTVAGNGLRISGNAVLRASTGAYRGTALWNPGTLGSDPIIVVTLKDAPTVNMDPAVFMRADGSAASYVAGSLSYIDATHLTGGWSEDGPQRGVPFPIFAVAAGDQVAFRLVGQGGELWYRAGGVGKWRLIDRQTGIFTNVGDGLVALSFGGTDVFRFDDFDNTASVAVVYDTVTSKRSLALTDTLTTMSDSLAKAGATPRTVSDTLATVSDTLASKRTRAISDTIATVSDSVAVARVFARSVSDTAAIMSDAVATSRKRRLTDTAATMSDGLARSLAASRSATDTGATVSDAVASLRRRQLADTIATIIDTFSPAVFRAVTDTIATVTDTLVTKRSRSVSDTAATVSDTLASSRVRVLTDTLATVSDSLVKTSGVTNRSVTDTLVTSSDSISLSRVFNRALADTAATVSDSIARAAAHLRAMADAGVAGISTTWPTVPAFGSANFLDHFDSFSTADWTSVASGTGAVSVTDSYLKCDAPANSAAFVYRNAKIDKTKSQLWLVCWAHQQLGGGPEGPLDLMLVNGASAPTADTAANINAKTLVRSIFAGGSPAENEIIYYTSGNVKQRWNPATPAWQSAYVAARAPLRTDDYYITGLEIDGPGGRWRLFGLGQSFAAAGTYTFDQGWRLFYLTDWVTWANTRSNSDVWLVLGLPMTNVTAAQEARFEWVRYAEASEAGAVDALLTPKKALGDRHRVRHYYSFDGLSFVPQDRSSWAIDLGASGAPDDGEIERPRTVWDGASTDWTFYTGWDGVTTRTICLASASYARPQNGPWTKYGSNPLIGLGSSGANDDAGARVGDVVVDLTEPDSNKRWKMLYLGFKVSDGKPRIMYATAPEATGPWTKQGTVIDVGSSGAYDEGACWDPVIVHYGSEWHVFYEAHTAADVVSLRRAHGSDLGSLTKDTADYTFAAPNAKQALTASLSTAPGRTVTVADTTGFAADAPVVLTQDNVLDDYSASRIRKVVSSTQLELYHGLTGFTTAAPAKILQRNQGLNRSPRAIVRVGSEWLFYATFWDPWAFASDDASYGALIEEMFLARHSGSGPHDTVAALETLANPVVWRGFNQDQRSLENMTLLNPPYGLSASDSVARTKTAAPVVADTLVTPSDTVASLRARRVNDTAATMSDAISTAGSTARAVSDTLVNPNDTVSRTASHPRAVTDTLATVTDSVARTATHPRAATDTLATVTDSLASNRIRRVSDTLVTGTDSMALRVSRFLSDQLATIVDTPSAATFRSVTDTLATVTDSLASNRVRRVTDTAVTVSDSLASRRVRVLTDTLATVTDSISQQGQPSRAVSDQLVTASDTVARAVVFNRTATDTAAAVTDTLAVSRFRPKTASDTLATVTESISVRAARSATDTLATVTDSLASNRVRAVMDTLVTVSDQITSRSVSRSITDTGATVNDAISTAGANARALTDTVATVSDSLASKRSRSVTDTAATVSDTVSKTRLVTRSATDTAATVSESLALRVTRVLADQFATIVDTPHPATFRSVTDTLATVSDSLATQRSRSVTDTAATVTDSLATKRSRTVTDTAATITDALSFAGAIARAVSDTLVNPSDTVQGTAAHARDATDTAATVSDSVSLSRVRTRSVTDTIATVTDTTSVRITRSLADTAATISDSLNATSGLLLVDTAVTFSDQLARHLDAFRVSSDTVVTSSDTVSASKRHTDLLTDTIATISESLASRRVRPLIDTGAAMTDAIARSLRAFRQNTDTAVAMSDSITGLLIKSPQDQLVTMSDEIRRALIGRGLSDTAATMLADFITSQAGTVLRQLTDTILVMSDFIEGGANPTLYGPIGVYVADPYTLAVVEDPDVAAAPESDLIGVA